MERILNNICQESTKIQDIQNRCLHLLNYINTTDKSDDNVNYIENFEPVLQLFKLCACSEIVKLNSLGIDLVRLYTRKLDETCNDNVKENIISSILCCCREILANVSSSDDIFAILVEISATFSLNLSINHVVEIIELCHQQIKSYVLQNSSTTNNLQSRLPILNFGFTSKISVEDKALSVIYLTAGQVCHYFTKHRITGSKKVSVGADQDHKQTKISQDFVHLLLYLSKKLETKVCFYRDFKSVSSRNDDSQKQNSFEGDDTKSRIFLLIKIFNCFYLKCLHYTLLTIPDAWKYMTNYIMEIICKHLNPLLVDILTPQSTVPESKTKSNLDQIGNNFGRGCERLRFGNSATGNNKDLLFSSLIHQERQYVYKISIELLRLFGLENSMRPLLESLYHRIFLLPPMDQRMDSLIYMQEILKNPLLVIILISNPVCLFGPSTSSSQNLDLFQIFIDAIKEAIHSTENTLSQLSLLCLATLFATLNNLTSFASGQSLTTANNNSLSEAKLSVLNSPIIKMVLCYAANHQKMYANNSNNQQFTARHYRGQTLPAKCRQYSQRVQNRYNFLNIKDRICGYDSETFEKKLQSEQLNKLISENCFEQCPSGEITDNDAALSSDYKRQYMREDFNYQDKLRELVQSNMSSTGSNDDSRIAEFDKRCSSVAKTVHCRMEQASYLHLAKIHSKSFHMSHENVNLADNWTSFTGLKRTNSDNRLDLHLPFESANCFDNSPDEDSESSVFEISSNTSSQDSELNDDNCENNKEEEEEDGDDADEFDEMELYRHLDRPRSMFGMLDKDSASNLSYFERALARIFIRKLQSILPDLINLRNVFVVDEFLQKFASNYCKELFKNLKQFSKAKENEINLIDTFKDLSEDEIATLTKYRHQFDSLFINADGIYLATYSALVLNLKLFYLGYYESLDKNVIPLSESDFIDDIFNYHITIYLSPHFLAEIYQNILADNFFAFIQENLGNQNLDNLALINLLHDIDVINVSIPNAFMLSDYARLERMARGSHKTDHSQSTSSVPSSPTISRPESFRNLNLLIRRFFTFFWDPILSCLRVALETKYTFQQLETINSTYISSVCSILECENKQIFFQLKNWNVCIQISQVLLNSSVQAGYYRRLDTIYELLYLYISKYSCQEKNFIQDFKSITLKKSASSQELAYERFNFVLSPIQIQSIKTLLSRSSYIGSLCPKIWKHVFNLCKFVTDLENLIFRSCHSSLLSRARISINTILRSNSISFGGSTSGAADSTGIHTDHYQNVYNFNTLPGISEVENSNLEAIFDSIIDKMKSKNIDLDLKSKELEQVVEYLSLFVTQIFENVSLKCNLSLLSNFVTELCLYSKEQLQLVKNNSLALNSHSLLDQGNNVEYKSLMLFRLVEVVLRFVRNGRPLLHFMKIWPITASHLVEASAHKDLTISKKSITSMHDIINAVLSSYSEMDFFNFNESIFKSYEKLLFFELCNSDCQQELLLNSICEFVEGASNEIRSGWKSIFKALRGIRLIICEENSESTINCIHHVQILVDTFEAFLHTENMHVFTYASADFVLCIFHLIRNVSVISTSINVKTSEPENNFEETFIIFLKYLQKFTKILRSVYDVPEDLFVIAPNIRAKKARLIDLDCLNESLNKIDSCDLLSFNLNLVDSSTLATIDKPFTLLQLWCLVFDEYSTTIYTSLLKYRPMLLEVFFTLIQCVADMNETLDFAIYCFNHTILPLMQNLLRETKQTKAKTNSDSDQNIDEFYIFLKSWLEVFNNYIIRFMTNRFDQIVLANENEQDNITDNSRFESIGLLFKQTLLVYIECLNGEYHDLISILALSSIRYLLLSLHRILVSYFWDILIDCFKIGHQLTLNPLRLLMNSFANLSSNFSSDLDRIKIMTTREMDIRSNDYLRKRARQVFFVDPSSMESVGKFNINQHQLPPMSAKSETFISDNRIYTIIVETSSGLNNSLSYNLLITQIHNHLALLQILCSVLTFNIKPSLSNLMNFLYEDFNEICNNSNKDTSEKTVPVLNLNLSQYRELCFILKQSFILSMSFDSRPGLKFLIQHISQTNAAANLYQLSSLVWCAQFAVNFSICCSTSHRNEECLSILDDLLSEISTIYVQKITSFQNELGTTNQSSSNSLSSFILQPLKIFDDDDLIAQQFKLSTDSNSLEFKEMNDCKVYQLASSHSISQFMKDYQKVKHRQSNNQHELNKRQTFSTNCFTETSEAINLSNCGSTSSNNVNSNSKTEKFLELDSQIFVRIWSDILVNCIKLDIQCDKVSFNFMLPQYKQLIKTLVLHGSDSNIRLAISRWIETLADNFTAPNRDNNSLF